ncbi:MAG TPA: gluconokinase [Pyrinomonadaceae bacterium]|nr:gluconokinase [Pyrinomonadaceae bacterium]
MIASSILSIDIGSSSVRAGLYDSEAKPIARLSAKRELAFSAFADGGSEMNAEKAFAVVCGVIDEVLAKAERRRVEITHVAMCSFWHSLMGVDSRGKPTTRVLGWADTRSREYSGVLKSRFDEDDIHHRTGAHIHSSFWPAKLLWLRRERPDAFARNAKWLGFGDYVAKRLCGEAVTSVSMASATGIFDQRKCDWDSELLRYLKVKRSSLPAIAADGETRRLIRGFAKRWPRLSDAEIFPPIGDGAADHLGSCGIGSSGASLMIGTSAAMRVAYEGEPPKTIPQGLWSYRVDRDRVIVGGALSDGGNLYEKFRRELKVPKGAEDEMRRRGAASHGLLVLPFFFGERSTGYREDACGAIVGVNVDADKVDLLQAAMEGVAYRLAGIHDRLRRICRIKTIVASGGALQRSVVWRQIVADVLGRDLVLSPAAESASTGAVLLALESVGKIESIERFQTLPSATLEHHPSCHAAYKAARRAHDRAVKYAHAEQS